MCTCDKHPTDLLNIVNFKLALLTDVFSQTPPDKDIILSGNALTGMYWFLQEAEEACTAVLNLDKEVSQ